MAFKIHPFAEHFPRMGAEEYETLKADICEHGQQIPIVKQGDTILDGRHRYDACRELDIEPLIKEWEGSGSPLAFIVSMNLHRRHLDPGQRGLIAAEIRAASPNFRLSQDVDGSGQKSGITFPEAAELMQVSKATVEDAAVVLEKGTAAEIDAVRTGKAAPSAVAREIRSGKTPTERAAARKKKERPENKATAPKPAEPARAATLPKHSTRELEIVARMKEAVTALAFMPPDAGVVAGIVRDSDAKQYVEQRMYKAADRLKAFIEAWDEARNEELTARAKA
jgi:hypothetical protein